MSGTTSRVGLFAPLGIFFLIVLIGYYGFQLEDPHRLPSALLGQPFPEFRAPLLQPADKPGAAALHGPPDTHNSPDAHRPADAGHPAATGNPVNAGLRASADIADVANPVEVVHAGLNSDASPTAPFASRDDLLGELVLVNVWATWCPTCKAEHAELQRIRREENVRIVGVNYKDDPAAARRWLQEFGNPYEFNIVDPDGSLGVELGVYGAPETFLLDTRGIILYKRIGEITRQVWREELAPRIARLRASTNDPSPAR